MSTHTPSPADVAAFLSSTEQRDAVAAQSARMAAKEARRVKLARAARGQGRQSRRQSDAVVLTRAELAALAARKAQRS